MAARRETDLKLKAFAHWLAQRDLSTRTIYCYQSRVRQFLKYCSLEEPSFAIDDGNLSMRLPGFVNYCLRQLSFNERSINSMLTAIDWYLNFLQQPLSTVPRLFTATPTPKVLSVAQEYLMKLAIEQTPSSKFRAVVVLFLYAGVRMDELRHLTVDSISVSLGALYLSIGTKENSRTIALPEHVLDALTTWLQDREAILAKVQTDILFPNATGRAMSIAAVDAIVRTVARCSRLNLSAQLLRNTFVVNLIDDGLPLAQVGYLAGIQRLSTLTRFRALAQTRQIAPLVHADRANGNDLLAAPLISEVIASQSQSYSSRLG